MNFLVYVRQSYPLTKHEYIEFIIYMCMKPLHEVYIHVTRRDEATWLTARVV